MGMALDRLEANAPVLICIGARTFRTRVIRRLGKDLYLDALREGSASFAPEAGQTFELRYGDEVRFWTQPARVRDVLDPIPIMVVTLLGEARRLEQRHALRANLLVPLEYALMRSDAEVYATTTLDLSTIGLRFPCVFRPWTGLDLRMRLTLSRMPVPLIGRVVRVARAPAQIRGHLAWETSVQFQIPTPQARRHIGEAVRRALQNEAARQRG